MKIERVENKDVFKLAWYKDEQRILHGIGFMVDDCLALAWGSTDRKFDFSVLTLSGIEQTELNMQKVIWDNNVSSCTFIRQNISTNSIDLSRNFQTSSLRM